MLIGSALKCDDADWFCFIVDDADLFCFINDSINLYEYIILLSKVVESLFLTIIRR